MHDKTFLYKKVIHTSQFDAKENNYCRMADSILPFDSRRCIYCPLVGDGNGYVTCQYHDLTLPDERMEKTSVQAKRYTKALINAGIVPQFPDFITKCGTWNEEFAVYEKALQFAANAHHGDCRKGTKVPYIVHPVEASMIVYNLCEQLSIGDVDKLVRLISAAALHDVVEDTKYTAADIKREFGNEIAALVTEESENKRENMAAEASWQVRKQETLDHLENASTEVKMVTLGDKLSNMRDIAQDYKKHGDDMWKKFNQTDKRMQAWYYISIGHLLNEFEGTALYREYMHLCEVVFDEIYA